MKALATSLGSAAALVVLNVGLAFAASDNTGGTVGVPLPGSLVLLVTGAVGLAAAGWWTRKK